MSILDPKSEAGQRAIRNAAFEKPTTAGDPQPEEWTRQRIEAALKSDDPNITIEDGLWLLERCRPLHAGAEPAFSENETKDVLTALYQDGHVDLVLADRVAALMKSGAA